MSSLNDDDLDNPSQEYSLTPELAKPSRALRLNMRQPVSSEIAIPGVSEEPGQVDFSRYLHAMRRNWLLGSVLGLICSAPLAALMWYLNPNEYTAVESFRVVGHVAPLVFDTMDNHHMAGRTDLKLLRNTQKQLILQPLALNKALKDSGTLTSPLVSQHPDAIAWLQKELKVTFPDDAELMNVSLTMSDPAIAHRIVKAVCDVYMTEVVTKDKAVRLSRVEQLEKILADTEEKVRKKRAQLKNTVDSLGTGDSVTLNLAQQSVLSQYGFLRQELSRIHIEVLKMQGELELRNSISAKANLDEDQGADAVASTESPQSNGETAVGAPKAGSAPSDPKDNAATKSSVETRFEDISDVRLLEQIETDPVVAQLTNQITRLEKGITLDEKRYEPKIAASFTTKKRAQLDEAKKKLSDRKNRIVQLFEVQNGPVAGRSDNLPLKIRVLEQQDEQIRKEMKSLEAESKKFGLSSMDVETQRQEIDRLIPVVERISQEIERTKIELNSGSKITQYPSIGIPTTGSNKRRLPMTAAAGVFGLLFPMGLLVFFDSRKNHVNSVRTINNGLKLPVLGSIPRIPNRVIRRLNDPSNTGAKIWRARVTESMSAVTAMLLRKLQSEGHRVIMISSARSGEGKSTLSEQIARSLADSGHRTLLIDFDLRRPNMHLRFDTQLEPGVSEVLRVGADLLQTVQLTDSPNLSLLTAGNTPGSLLLETANGTLEAFFNHCRTEYEIVLVDSSPILPVVDGRLIGQHTDGAILTIVKDTSQIPQVVTTRRILEDYGIPVLGCVFTGDDSDGYDGVNGTYGSYSSAHMGNKPAVALESKPANPTSAM